MSASHQKLLAVASEIEREWLRHDNACEAFADLAWEKTRGLDLSEFGNLSNTPALLEDPYIASLQRPSAFSDLYFKVHDNGKFWIEVLNWWGSDINVHDHDFSGVQFQRKGTSLNVIYQFERRVSEGGYR